MPMKKLFLKISAFGILPLLMLSLFSCKKAEPLNSSNKNLPELRTDSITKLGFTGATSGGALIFDKGFPVTELGLVWATHKNPTVTDLKYKSSKTTGSFTYQIKNLIKNTTYYIRAYAINSEGTGYGNEISFKPGTVSDIDGNEYPIIIIDGTTWLAGDLKVTHYNNGDPIPLVTDDKAWAALTTGGSAYVNGDKNNTKTYGLLYNWFAATDKRKICPKGYHVPTSGGFMALHNYVSPAGIDGGGLKTKGFSNWKSPNTDATNILDWNGVGSGHRKEDGTYEKFQEEVIYWSTSNYLGGPESYGYWLRYNDNGFYYLTYDNKSGNCIRCQQD